MGSSRGSRSEGDGEGPSEGEGPSWKPPVMVKGEMVGRVSSTSTVDRKSISVSAGDSWGGRDKEFQYKTFSLKQTSN